MTAIVTVDDQALDGVVQVRDLVDVAPEKGLEVGDPQRPVVVDERIVHELDEIAETRWRSPSESGRRCCTAGVPSVGDGSSPPPGG